MRTPFQGSALEDVSRLIARGVLTPNLAIESPVTSNQFGNPVGVPGNLPQRDSLGAGFAARPEIRQWRGKRAVDILLAVPLVIVLAPVVILAAIAVWLEAPRSPVLFRQRRVGRGGREFWMLKFRSMQPDAEERLHAQEDLLERFYNGDHKIPDHLDPRITWTGRFLRRSSIDELPQLFNVLAGHMSLVGPRPVERTQLGQYQTRKLYYLAMRPGLTGLWQVGGRSRVTFPLRAQLDELYACRCSFLMDLRILLRTPFAVLRGLNED